MVVQVVWRVPGGVGRHVGASRRVRVHQRGGRALGVGRRGARHGA